MEYEAKFWLPDFENLRKQLLAQGAQLSSPHHLERNLRFDTASRTLTNQGEVLRLRQADRITLTYKHPGEQYEIRQELEIEVDDFDVAKMLISSLGYEVIHIYEKYRETFTLDRCQVMLDEVPYGTFAEIEGPDLEHVRKTCGQIGLNWDERVSQTYLSMFEALVETMDPRPGHATFDAFKSHFPIDITGLHLKSGYLLPGDDG
jgi:adenylate cyclase class 2